MTGSKIAKRQREVDETETSLVPESEANEGQTLDPGCYDEAEPRITMMSERGKRVAEKSGQQVPWRNTMVKR